jgi:hypothetical protein
MGGSHQPLSEETKCSFGNLRGSRGTWFFLQRRRAGPIPRVAGRVVDPDRLGYGGRDVLNLPARPPGPLYGPSPVTGQVHRGTQWPVGA